MPTYPYACEPCQQGFEVMKPMAAAADPAPCPHCGAPGVRLFGVAHIKTANTFMAHRPMGGAQFGDKTREHYLRAAREHGVSTDGKAYDSRLARYPGDPEAWIQSQDEARALIEKRGWSCDGDIKVAGPEKARPKDKPLADDLVAEHVETILEEKLGPDFTTASGPVVEKAVDDVMNRYAQPSHLLKD